jgi:hypothetical protein
MLGRTSSRALRFGLPLAALAGVGGVWFLIGPVANVMNGATP